MYNGKNGTICNKRPDGTFNIDYDDEEFGHQKEFGVKHSSLGRVREDKPSSRVLEPRVGISAKRRARKISRGMRLVRTKFHWERENERENRRKKEKESWDNLLALANYHYESSNRIGSRPSLASAIKSSRGDDHKKLEKLIGRSNLDDYQDKFEQYDMGRNDELELEDVVEAFDALGRRCSLKEVKVRVSRAPWWWWWWWWVYTFASKPLPPVPCRLTCALPRLDRAHLTS